MKRLLFLFALIGTLCGQVHNSDVTVKGWLKVLLDYTELDSLSLRVIKLDVGTDINEFSIDGTFAGNSDDALVTEKAIKTYVDATVTGFPDPMTTRGDIIYRNSSNITARLGLGSNKYVLQSDGTDLAWSEFLASEMNIVDGGSIITATEVEGALQEHRTAINLNTSKVTMTYPSAGIALSTGSAWSASITDNSANWNTAYTDRLKWDGGSTGLVAGTGRTSLGGTTIGQNIFTSTNPGAITFGRANADNTFSWLSATNFRTAINVDIAGTDNSTDVTLNASATTGGMSLSTQEISNRAATNAQTGYMTAALVTNIETNNAKNYWDYNADTNKIINVVDPTNPQDAATMIFVENTVGFTFDYFFGNTSDAEAGIYYVMTDNDLGGGESNIDTNIGSSGDDKPLANFLTIDGEPGIQQLESGIYEVHIHIQRVSGSSSVDGIYWELYKRASVGTGGAETLLGTSETSGAVTIEAEYNIHLSLTSPATILSTGRLGVKFYANLSGGSGAVVRLIQEGTTASHFEFQTTSNILSNIFVRRDGTTPMTTDWGFGGFSLSGINELGLTGTRVTKGWFADLESSNDITIGGNALATIYQPLDAALTNISGLVYVSPSFIKLTADDTYAVRTLAETLSDLSGVASEAFSFNDQNITNVGQIDLDTIDSDGGSIAIGTGTNTLTLTDNTDIVITLGTDTGDDFIVSDSALVVSGDNKNVGISISEPYTKLHIKGDIGFYPREQQALVTFVFDDANDSDINVMKPLFDAKGEVACSAIKISNVGTGNSLTIANLVTLENAGWEMLSHTVNHPDLTTISDDSIRSELSFSRDSLETWGLTVNNLAYPGGDNNEAVRRITREYYRSGRGISGNTNEQILATYNLKTQNIDNHTGLATYKVYVDSAESQLKWLIFYLHDTDTDDSTAIAELIDYIQAKSISIVTVNQALDLVGNILDIGVGFAVGEKGTAISTLSVGTNNLLSPLEVAGSGAFTTAYNSYTGIYISNFNAAAGDGNFGVGLEFSGLGGAGKKRAAIVPVQKGGDNDDMGLAFFTANTDGVGAVSERMRITDLGNLGIGTTDPVNLLNVDGAYNYFADSSSVNDSWGFVTTGIEVLTEGLDIKVKIAVVNTDAATLQINALGAKAVHKNHNVALATNDVEVGQILHLVYDGTDWQMLSQLAQ